MAALAVLAPDVMIIDEHAKALPALEFTRRWVEAMEWYVACGGNEEEWGHALSFPQRAQWIESVRQLEIRITCSST